MTDQEFSE